MKMRTAKLTIVVFLLSALQVGDAKGDCLDMVLITGGQFQMGDHFDEANANERPVHAVLVDAFFMSKYEITNSQYCDYLKHANSLGLIEVRGGVVYASPGGTDPYCNTHSYDTHSQIDYVSGTFSVRTKGGRDMSDDPMVEVSWYGSVAYCNWRSGEEGYESCYNLVTWDCNFSKHGYRLPTEAEWEYAARGGLSGKRFPWADPNITHSLANYYANPGAYPYDENPTSGYHPDYNDVMPYTAPVGSFSANGYGLYDMAGNVFEWCNDWYDGNYYDVSPYDNPTGPASSNYRVLRGGTWRNDADYCRVARRGGVSNPGHRFYYYGIRIARNDEPPCWKEVFFDDFDDGNYDGWSVTHPKTGEPATAPDIVPSPEGYSLRGVGSGYSHDPGLNVFLTYPLVINNAGQLKVEMRAKSGPQWPNSAWVVLISGDDSYSFGDYGEGNQWAQFTPNVDGQSEWYNYSINANVWHDFAWIRDADGWWSLCIDGNLVWEDFCQDNRLTSFYPIGMHILRDQSEIEWVRISGVCAIPVAVDIKPQSCPNPINVKSKGMLPVAILGTEEFDASNIDPASIRLKYGDDSEGVAPIRSSLEDVATPVADGNECECNEDGSDGYTGLTVKFDTQLVLAAIGDVNNGDVLPLDLTGVLNDGTPIEGTDCMVVVGNFKAFKKGDINKDGITNTIDFTLMAETWLQSTLPED